MFLLDTLDNLPRLRIPNSLMNAFCGYFVKAGREMYPLCIICAKYRQTSVESSGVPTIQAKSPKGNIYSMNDPRMLVAMVSKSNYLNAPSSTYIFHVRLGQSIVCNHIRRYPVIPQNGIISEVYHAQKWRKDAETTHIKSHV